MQKTRWALLEWTEVKAWKHMKKQEYYDWDNAFSMKHDAELEEVISQLYTIWHCVWSYSTSIDIRTVLVLGYKNSP